MPGFAWEAASCLSLESNHLQSCEPTLDVCRLHIQKHHQTSPAKPRSVQDLHLLNDNAGRCVHMDGAGKVGVAQERGQALQMGRPGLGRAPQSLWSKAAYLVNNSIKVP